MSEELNKYEITGDNGKKPSVFEFLRMRGEHSYPTDDIKIYASILSSMNLGDLQTHAMDKGIKPSPDRRKLEANLINQFKSTMLKRKASKQSRKVSQEEVQRISEQRQKSLERTGFLRTRV